MNKLYSFLIVLVLISCKNNTSAEADKVTITKEIENFDWLLGDWQRTNETEGKSTFEHWKKVNDSLYKSLAYTMKDQDTIWLENVNLTKNNDTWSFDVKGKGDNKATSFIVSEMDAESFTCVNDKNEFPKKIIYFKNGTNIRAEISGGDMMIPFEFDRIKP